MPPVKYKDIRKALEGDIASGVFTASLPGVHRLAARYRVNHVTVMRAVRSLCDDGVLAVDGTRGTRILAAGERKRYRRIAYVGLIYIESREFPYLKEMETVCSAQGYETTVVRFTSRMSFERATPMLASLPVDGMLFSYCRPHDAMMRALFRAQMPFIQLAETDDARICWADADNAGGIRTALAHLNDNGHERIAFCTPRNSNAESHARTVKAYRSFMRSIGSFDGRLFYAPDTVDALIAKHGERYRTVFGGQCAAYLAACRPRPTAVFVHARETAHAMIDAFSALGLRVPGDISVIAAADDERDAADEKKLTVLVHPRIEIVRYAAELLIGASAERMRRNKLFARELLVHGSVKNITNKKGASR